MALRKQNLQPIQSDKVLSGLWISYRANRASLGMVSGAVHGGISNLMMGKSFGEGAAKGAIGGFIGGAIGGAIRHALRPKAAAVASNVKTDDGKEQFLKAMEDATASTGEGVGDGGPRTQKQLHSQAKEYRNTKVVNASKPNIANVSIPIPVAVQLAQAFSVMVSFLKVDGPQALISMLILIPSSEPLPGTGPNLTLKMDGASLPWYPGASPGKEWT